MGCSSSKLDNEEAVQLCKDRKHFIKQAVEQRTRFASYHLAYIHSLKRVSDALRNYVEGDEPREFLLDSFRTPFSTPVKKTHSGFISISPKLLSHSEPKSNFQINYLRPSGNPSVTVEEAPPRTPENARVQAFSPPHHYGVDGLFAMQSSPMSSSSFFTYPMNETSSSSFFTYPTNDRPNNSNYPPPSPQNSQWDFFWNPFSSLDYYGYPNRNSLDQGVLDDDITGLRQVREQEGIPELEEETEHEEIENKTNVSKERANNNKPNVKVNHDRDKVIVEDVDDDDDEDEDDECDHIDCTDCGSDSDSESGGGHEREVLKEKRRSIEVAKNQSVGQVSKRENAIENRDNKKEIPGFAVYVNRRPTSMAEVIKDLEAQFAVICSAANVVSAMLEASKAQYASSSNDLSAMKMLNPVALFRTPSSRSSSSRFLMHTPTKSKDEAFDSSSDFSDDSGMFSGSHQSTLDRLYAWEKKLYEEVRGGERVRIAYEKKCSQLRDKVVKGEDPSSIDKSRAAIRDLHTQIKVSIHSVEAISKRIETLRDEELQPQLLELVQGLEKMWKIMAESHQSQKRTLDEAKLLLASAPSKTPKTRNQIYSPPSDPQRLAQSASKLEAELRNWQSCFESWIASQRSYIHALTGWLLRCIRCDPDSSKLPFSPRRAMGAPPIYRVCIQWSRSLDAVREGPVIDGLDFFAAGMGSIYTQQLREDNRKNTGNNGMEIVEMGHFEDDSINIMSAEKMAEVAIKVLCAGMSVAISSLAEFAVGSAEGYAELIKQPESATCAKEMAKTRV